MVVAEAETLAQPALAPAVLPVTPNARNLSDKIKRLFNTEEVEVPKKYRYFVDWIGQPVDEQSLQLLFGYLHFYNQDWKRVEEKEKNDLAPYAQLSFTSQGREYQENECDFRPAFQRDRDRIIHSTAFRRLEYKTQVFINHEGDYYRTRLTHTLEVGQIARGLARMLRVNEDLAETIALAHDLGHTPFGHAGETVMHNLMQDFGGFEHNKQSLRVVTILEDRYPNFPGLNLTYEVREGIMKHQTEYDKPDESNEAQAPTLKRLGHPTIEAQLVNFADEIAYMNHDLDDGIQHGMISFKDLEDISIWSRTLSKINEAYPDITDKVRKHRLVSRLIHTFISDLTTETLKRIEERNIRNLDDVRTNGKNLVSFSSQMLTEVRALKKYLFKNMYRHWRVERMAIKARQVLEDLFAAYTRDPGILPDEVQAQIDASSERERVICDYIAGMTDRFALQEHENLFKF